MNVYFMDTDFNVVKIVDRYTSLIWADRYDQYGDFELYLPIDYDLISMVQKGYYVEIDESEHTMIVEHISIDSDVEQGAFLTYSGRSLESILERRIVWGFHYFVASSWSVASIVSTLINMSIVEPSYENHGTYDEPGSAPERKIEGFVLADPITTDADILEQGVRAQYTGDNLYDTIRDLCSLCDCGFKVLLDDDFNFVFSLYKGFDRSYNQNDLPYVAFSPEFDNILSSNYSDSDENYRNVALIAGEGEGAERRYHIYSDTTYEGLYRRELFVDARDISSTQSDGTTMPDEDYNGQLQNRGKEKLSECRQETLFEGEANYNRGFIFGKDYFLGDMVSVSNEFGIEAAARIVESVISDDVSGYAAYPTFEMRDDPAL